MVSKADVSGPALAAPAEAPAAVTLADDTRAPDLALDRSNSTISTGAIAKSQLAHCAGQGSVMARRMRTRSSVDGLQSRVNHHVLQGRQQEAARLTSAGLTMQQTQARTHLAQVRLQSHRLSLSPFTASPHACTQRRRQCPEQVATLCS